MQRGGALIVRKVRICLNGRSLEKKELPGAITGKGQLSSSLQPGNCQLRRVRIRWGVEGSGTWAFQKSPFSREGGKEGSERTFAFKRDRPYVGLESKEKKTSFSGPFRRVS